MPTEYEKEYGNDGIRNHPDRDLKCSICGGGGWLDDGENWGMVLVPCVCTGQCPPDVVKKMKKNGMIKE